MNPAQPGVARRGLVALLTVVFVAVAVLAMWEQRILPPTPIDTDTYSAGPLGHRALVQRLEARGMHCLVDRQGVGDHASAPVFFIEPRSWVDEKSLFDRVLDRASAGLDTVVVLPKWTLDHATAPRGSVRIPKAQAQSILTAALPSSVIELRREDVDIPQTAQLRRWTLPSRWGPRTVVLQERQTLRVDDPSLEVLVGTRRSALVVRAKIDATLPNRKSGRGTTRPSFGSVILISDPDIWHNYNLGRGDHSQIALDLLATLDTDAVVIDEVMHGHHSSTTLAGVMGQPPGLWLAIGALLFTLLVGWAAIRRWALLPATTAIPASVQSHLLEPAATALVGTASTHRLRGLIASYLTLALSDLADRLAVPPNPEKLLRFTAIDEIARLRGIEGGAQTLWIAVAEPCDSKALLRLADQAHALRKRLLEENRLQ